MKSKATASRKLLAWLGAVALGTLLGCSGQNESDYAQLTGQVGGTGGADSKVSHYAASRFLEHVSMGPSPSAVAQVRAQGIESWIDRQQKLAPSIIRTPYDVANFQLNVKVDEDRARAHHESQLHNLFIGGEDQLRIRTSWILSNFLVVSTRKVQHYGASEYFNMLQTHAFGQYGDLLKAVTRNPAMGFYLDNASNHRASLNENYGRELMQLFSVGLVQLNMDGTPKRDANGKVLETYSQKDVIETTRQAVARSGVGSLDEVRLAGPLVAFSASMKARSSELKKFLFAQLYRHPQVMHTTGQAQQVVRELFAAYVDQPAEMPTDFAVSADLHRSVADYIAGMTDRFALREHERLTGRKLL